MKKLVNLFAIISFLAFTAMQSVADPDFKFEKESHNFGKIPKGTPVSVDFVFTNTGTSPLIISDVESTCGCTVPKYPTAPVAPGAKGTITVTFNAASVQAFTKAVTIKSNARTPVKVLYVKGEVVPVVNF